MKNLLLFALLCAFFVLPFNSALLTFAKVVPPFEIAEGNAEQNIVSAEQNIVSAEQNADSAEQNIVSAEQNADTVKYNGKIYHIFFHSLILYPEMAFKSQNAKGYNDWMTTRSEFKKILNKLYENNFVLVDIDLVRQAKGKEFPFPKGKKPLIISVDDVNYYETMKGDGFAEKLIVDENGEIATTVRTPKDAEIIDYEGDVIPIVNRFVEKHRNFSFRGAKGIVGVTGFDGVFGYRVTKLNGDAYKNAFKNAKSVANSLKSNGWKIACHSYYHSAKFKDGSITLKKLKNDIKQWNLCIAPITGKTNIFIAPYGTQFTTNDSRFTYLCDSGFNIYCSVYKRMGTAFSNGCMISERLNFDGFTMLKYPSRITSCFFDIEGIVDKARPKLL